MTDAKEKTQAVAAAMLAVKTKIAGTAKRHDAIITDLGRSMAGKPDRERMAESLATRLMRNEGIILSSNIYGKLTGQVPSEVEMFILQKSLEDRGIELTCIYHHHPESKITAALFIIIHRDIEKAIEYRDSINEALGITAQKPAAMLVKTFIKIAENLGKDITLEKLLAACQLLQNDEVYCISMNVFIYFQIDPNQAKSLLDKAGFQITPLLKPTIDLDTLTEYQQYENLVGLLISRSPFGIEWGKANVEIVLKVCQTAEEGLFKPSSSTVLQ